MVLALPIWLLDIIEHEKSFSLCTSFGFVFLEGIWHPARVWFWLSPLHCSSWAPPRAQQPATCFRRPRLPCRWCLICPLLCHRCHPCQLSLSWQCLRCLQSQRHCLSRLFLPSRRCLNLQHFHHSRPCRPPCPPSHKPLFHHFQACRRSRAPSLPSLSFLHHLLPPALKAYTYQQMS